MDGIPQDIPSEFEAVPRIDSKPPTSLSEALEGVDGMMSHINPKRLAEGLVWRLRDNQPFPDGNRTSATTTLTTASTSVHIFDDTTQTIKLDFEFTGNTNSLSSITFSFDVYPYSTSAGIFYNPYIVTGSQGT